VIVLLVAPPLAWLARAWAVAHARLVRVLAIGIARAGAASGSCSRLLARG
jgi:hypothetical protein